MDSIKRKRGEAEAMQILQAKGILFDEKYNDEGKENSKPDLRYADGRYLEVTHTLHNHSTVCNLNRFQRKDIEEQLQIMSAAKEANDRNRKRNYPMTLEGLTDEGKEQFKRDVKVVRDHYGMDISDFTKHSEFNCDVPVIECSTDNIIRQVREKALKHTNGDTDLFVFILEDEYRCLCYLLETGTWNGCYNAFLNALFASLFPTIYICVWDFHNQKYDVENPKLLKFWNANALHWKLM